MLSYGCTEREPTPVCVLLRTVKTQPRDCFLFGPTPKNRNVNKNLFAVRHWAAGATLQYICSISQLTDLVDDVDAVVNLLPSEDRVEVVEPVL